MLGIFETFIKSAAEVEKGRTQLRALDVQLSHNREIFPMQANLMRDMIHALIDRRVDAVRQGFVETLSIYAEQCRHYMALQDRYTDAEIKATSPLERASFGEKLSEIKLELANIRRDAAKLYREMNRAILLIGGTMPVMAPENQQALALAWSK